MNEVVFICFKFMDGLNLSIDVIFGKINLWFVAVKFIL